MAAIGCDGLLKIYNALYSGGAHFMGFAAHVEEQF
jgi:hypothetical protein